MTLMTCEEALLLRNSDAIDRQVVQISTNLCFPIHLEEAKRGETQP